MKVLNTFNVLQGWDIPSHNAVCTMCTKMIYHKITRVISHKAIRNEQTYGGYEEYGGIKNPGFIQTSELFH